MKLLGPLDDLLKCSSQSISDSVLLVEMTILANISINLIIFQIKSLKSHMNKVGAILRKISSTFELDRSPQM